MFVLCTPVPVSWIMLKVQIYTYSAHVVLDTLIPPQHKIHCVWYINFMYMCISTRYIHHTGITCPYIHASLSFVTIVLDGFLFMHGYYIQYMQDMATHC